MTLHVLNFPRGPEVPGQLRDLADQIEAGDHGEVSAIALAMESPDDFVVSGLGNVDSMRMIALFMNGVTLISTSMLERD
jgi:hypothetical protein